MSDAGRRRKAERERIEDHPGIAQREYRRAAAAGEQLQFDRRDPQAVAGPQLRRFDRSGHRQTEQTRRAAQLSNLDAADVLDEIGAIHRFAHLLEFALRAEGLRLPVERVERPARLVVEFLRALQQHRRAAAEALFGDMDDDLPRHESRQQRTGEREPRDRRRAENPLSCRLRVVQLASPASAASGGHPQNYRRASGAPVIAQDLHPLAGGMTPTRAGCSSTRGDRT